MSSVMEELPDFHFEGVLAQIELFVTIHVTDTLRFPPKPVYVKPYDVLPLVSADLGPICENTKH